MEENKVATREKESKYLADGTEIYDMKANEGERVLVARTYRDEVLATEITAFLNSRESK